MNGERKTFVSFTAPERPSVPQHPHDATHVIDWEAGEALRHCVRMTDAAAMIGAAAELDAVVTALRALHAKATAVHDEYEEVVTFRKTANVGASENAAPPLAISYRKKAQ